MKSSIAPRILISLLGIAMILWGISGIALGFFGRSARAVVTSITREGGERTDGKPGRYTYNTHYTFTLEDGREISGFSKDISDAIYLKADGTGRISVKYFEKLPFINAPEEGTGFSAGQIILIAAGAALIFLINRGGRQRA